MSIAHPMQTLSDKEESGKKEGTGIQFSICKHLNAFLKLKQ
jgi:hypothetical protein